MPELLLTLKRREARRLKSGHPWIFANEVAQVEPHNAASGLCRVADDSGRLLGQGYYNRHSLICARLLTTQSDTTIDDAFFGARLEAALDRRRLQRQSGEAYRWVFGEADGLPGLVMDVYPGVLVIQVTTRGMEDLQPQWEGAVRRLMPDVQRVVRNDSALRQREQLTQYVGWPDGLPPVEVAFAEAGAPMVALPLHGQKTGFFLDQRDNRVACRRWAQGARVLDLFSYTGAWGSSMLQGGAQAVTFVDSSELALQGARSAVRKGGWDERATFHRVDATRYLDQARTGGELFDVVCVDPPDMVPTRKSRGPGSRRLMQLFRAAMEVVQPGGHAICSSCSFHLDDAEFNRLLREAAVRAGRDVALVWRGGASGDHPRPVALPEADYLKCAVVQVR